MDALNLILQKSSKPRLSQAVIHFTNNHWNFRTQVSKAFLCMLAIWFTSQPMAAEVESRFVLAAETRQAAEPLPEAKASGPEQNCIHHCQQCTSASASCFYSSCGGAVLLAPQLVLPESGFSGYISSFSSESFHSVISSPPGKPPRTFA